MQTNKKHEKPNTKVTVHIPKSDSEIIRQTKINRIYDILNPKGQKENLKNVV